MKIALICTHGGHLTEILQLLDAFSGYEIFFATHHSHRDEDLLQIAPAYLSDNIGVSPWRLFRSIFWAFHILRKERPDVILSTGAEIALPFFYVGKLLGMKTIFIEGLFRVENISRTGRLVYPLADAFFVQWPELLRICGPKARYEGAVI